MADAPKLLGRDWNYFNKLSVVNTTFGVAGTAFAADMLVPFSSTGCIFLNEGAGVVEYSFNGNTVHGELDSTKASSGLTFNNRVICLIWWRIKSGSSGPIVVSVHAW